ncbi:MAG: sigma 54-interacting transcriptional regulator [Polyangiaceae bacterium]
MGSQKVRIVVHDGDQDTIPVTARQHGLGAQQLSLRVTGSDFSATYRLDPDRSVLVGRGRDAGVCIDHGEVSRRHLLVHTGPPLLVKDLGSSNGTTLRGNQLIPHELVEISAGDPVRIGSLILVFEWEEVGERRAGDVAEEGRSPAMRRLYELVDRVAPARINVLIHGETGVGKEVLAEAIHTRSSRAHKPFLRLNCGAFSEPLLESELFGHEKGSFTGAAMSKPGLLESAEGGTVLLDEIGELPMALQVKLLRVLEERRVRRVGGLTAKPIDVRFVAATHRDLEGEVARGTFRQDLFFRLNGITLNIPPLRERVEEIEPLAEMFLAEAAEQEGQSRRLTLSPEARRLLRQHRWPGNVRELKNVMERAALLVRGDVVTRDDLPAERMEAGAEAISGDAWSTDLQRERMPRVPQPRPTLAPRAPEQGPPPPPSSSGFGKNAGTDERQRIIDALEQCAGNQTKAANLLGISRGTLLSRLSLYGIPRPRSAGRRSGSDTDDA